MRTLMVIYYGFLIAVYFLDFTKGYAFRGYPNSASSQGYRQDMVFYPHGLAEESSSHSRESTLTTISSSLTSYESTTSKPFLLTSTSSDDLDTPTVDFTSLSPVKVNHNNDLESESSFTARTRGTTTAVPSFLLDLISTYTESIMSSLPKLTTSLTSDTVSTEYEIVSTSIDKSITADYVIPVESSDVDHTTDTDSETITTTIETTQIPTESSVHTTLDVQPTTVLTLNTKYTTKPTTLFYRRTTFPTTEPSLDQTSTSIISHQTTYTDPKTTTSDSDWGTTTTERFPSTTVETSTSSTSVPSVRSTTQRADSPIDKILRKLSSMKHPRHLIELLKHHEGPKTLTSKLNKKRWKLLQNILQSFRRK